MTAKQRVTLEVWLLKLEEGVLSETELHEYTELISTDEEAAAYVADRSTLVSALHTRGRARKAAAKKVVAFSDAQQSARSDLGQPPSSTHRRSLLALAAALAIGLFLSLFPKPEASNDVADASPQIREVETPSMPIRPPATSVSSDEMPFLAIANRGSLNHPELASSAVAALAGTGEAVSEPLPEIISYNEHIRPILNQKCIACHGGVKKSGGVSYLFPEEALMAGESGIPAIVPGDPDGSEMLYRITTDDEIDLMPPPEHHERLSDREVALITKWIKDGAKFEDHWAFLAIGDVAPPEVENAGTNIDAFILDGLNERNLIPTDQADDYTQLRRLSLDLTGLPPTPDEILSFVESTDPDKYEKAVDRLLESPHYGERWAAVWMDVARYSDTMGFEKDPNREIWLYRDWLIDAFNDDLPYDEFLTHQLAGDLLEAPTREQLIATAFHRNTMTNTEGGTNDEEFRVSAVLDRTNTTFEALMGVTMNCVQCHSHPYDPIRMEEFYQVYALFNNSADGDRGSDVPVMRTHAASDREQVAALQAKADKLRKQIQQDLSSDTAAGAQFAANKDSFRKQFKEDFTAFDIVAVEGSEGTEFEHLGNGVIRSKTEPRISEAITVTVKVPADGFSLQGFRLDFLPTGDSEKPAGHLSFAKDGSLMVSAVQFLLEEGPKATGLGFAAFDSNAGTGSYGPQNLVKRSFNQQIMNSWKIPATEGETPWAIGTFGKAHQLEPGKEYRFRLAHAYPNARENITSHFQLRFSSSDALSKRRKLNQAALKEVYPDLWLAPELEAEPALDFWLHSGVAKHPEWATLSQIRQDLKKLKKHQVLVMREIPEDQQRESRLFIGGNWMNQGDVMKPGAPAAIAPWKDEFPKNRLGLAQWMTSRENALTARVAVNRVWEQLFGEGLVVTVEDMGTMGAQPAYQKLLDYLALRFKTDYQWSQKQLIREIVLSDAYRRDSKVTEKMLAVDPANRLLTRGPRFRLKAEMVRDQALFASSLLSSKMHGPSVMPYQPEGIWNSVYNKRTWETSEGEDQYRRAMYTFWKRTSPYPSMVAFDATAREICSPRRIRTNTPLQALVTLNDPAFVEAADALGQRMIDAGSELSERLNFGFLAAASRPIDDKTLSHLTSLYHQTVDQMSGNEKQAMAFIARIILNLDETLTKS